LTFATIKSETIEIDLDFDELILIFDIASVFEKQGGLKINKRK
jgi:hypothetical protein